ncbi:30S ribosome-binding factor RbfA [candidate division KSB1 bacterium]|nr:30S ribosome-binding factor RbfA [candidate division KSB1 bacterium]MBL7094877.1 30S ribosome-binding factor RbfA [candidate division KSB1 bacterium]
MKVKRSLRVSELIKREISDIIARKVRDRLVKSIIVTQVKVTDDLKIAKVYYRIIKDKTNKDKIEAALGRVSKFIRMEIGNRTELRYVPEIHFFYDSGMDEAARIDYLLEKLKKDQAE